MEAIKGGKAGKSILVIDDDRFIQKMFALHFSRQGLRVLAAMDGQEGYELALRHRPDLIVMDLMMPKMDGFETTSMLRAHPTTRRIPIVAVTAKVPRPGQPRYEDFGFAGYCTKPFHLDDLDSLIRKHLGARVDSAS